MAIDDPRIEYTDIPCPNGCGSFIEYYPAQWGPCHAGLFIDSMDEACWCPGCEQNFDPDLIYGEPKANP